MDQQVILPAGPAPAGNIRVNKQIDELLDKLELLFDPFIHSENATRGLHQKSKMNADLNKLILMLYMFKNLVVQQLEEKKKEGNIVGARLDKINRITGNINLISNNMAGSLTNIINYIEENI